MCDKDTGILRRCSGIVVAPTPQSIVVGRGAVLNSFRTREICGPKVVAFASSGLDQSQSSDVEESECHPEAAGKVWILVALQ